jgi:RNA polymerase sigma-70 factor (ECF subfamily)
MSFAWHEIRDHLMHSSSKLPFQRSFDAIRRTQATFAPFRDPAALLDGLHCTTGDPTRKNVILSALVSTAQGDGPACPRRGRPLSPCRTAADGRAVP